MLVVNLQSVPGCSTSDFGRLGSISIAVSTCRAEPRFLCVPFNHSRKSRLRRQATPFDLNTLAGVDPHLHTGLRAECDHRVNINIRRDGSDDRYVFRRSHPESLHFTPARPDPLDLIEARKDPPHILQDIAEGHAAA